MSSSKIFNTQNQNDLLFKQYDLCILRFNIIKLLMSQVSKLKNMYIPIQKNFIQLPSSFKNRYEFLNYLNNITSSFKFNKLYTQSNQIHSKTILYQCKYCDSFIKLRYKNTGILKVISSNTNHSHYQQIKSSSIQNSKLYSYQKLIQFFTNNHYETWIQRQQGIIHQTIFPDIILAVSPSMKSSAKKYGDSMSFDITYNCIKNITIIKKNFKVGIFSGWDTNRRILIFGVVTLANQHTQTLTKIFRQFFRIIDRKPNSIITDQQVSIKKSIAILKQNKQYQGCHIFDTWHILNNIYKTLNRIFRKYNVYDKQKISNYIEKFKNLIKQKNFQRGRKLLISLFEELDAEDLFDLQDFMVRFQQKIENICMWCIPNQYVGLATSTNEKINDLIKCEIPTQTTINILFQKVDLVTEKLISNSQNGYIIFIEQIEYLHDDMRLREIRQHIEKKPFKQFMKNYMLSYIYLVHQRDIQGDNFTLNTNYTDQKIYIQSWKCHCNYFQKVGIPCQHILCVAREFKQLSYLIFFNQRWIKAIVQNEKNNEN